MVCSLVVLYFDSLRLGLQEKTDCIKLYKTIDPEICSILTF